MNNFRIILAVGLCGVAQIAAAQGSIPPEDFATCRAVSDDDTRLDCYDGLAISSVGQLDSTDSEAQPVAATAAAATTAAAEPVSPAEVPIESRPTQAQSLDDIGLERSQDDFERHPVALDRCGYASNMLFYIYFENGQTWKYVGGKKLRLKDCGEHGVLVEDRLGFKLELPAKSTSIRVSRIR